MLDVKFIRENPDQVKESCRKRGVDCQVDRVLELDKKKRQLLQETEGLKAEQNKLGKDQQEKAKELKLKIKDSEPILNEVDKELNELILRVPNLLADDVPEGRDENDNQVLRKFKEPTQFDFKPKDHMGLGMAHNLIDTEKSAKISGARFNYLFNEAALMQFAISGLFLKH